MLTYTLAMISNGRMQCDENGRALGGEPKHTARTTKTNIECKPNDDVPERGHHHNLRLNFCITEHGWIGAGGGPVGDFLLSGLRACFRISVLLLLLILISFLSAIAYELQAV